jgi:hypothetical protein
LPLTAQLSPWPACPWLLLPCFVLSSQQYTFLCKTTCAKQLVGIQHTRHEGVWGQACAPPGRNINTRVCAEVDYTRAGQKELKDKPAGLDKKNPNWRNPHWQNPKHNQQQSNK